MQSEKLKSHRQKIDGQVRPNHTQMRKIPYPLNATENHLTEAHSPRAQKVVGTGTSSTRPTPSSSSSFVVVNYWRLRLFSLPGCNNISKYTIFHTHAHRFAFFDPDLTILYCLSISLFPSLFRVLATLSAANFRGSLRPLEITISLLNLRRL